MHIHKCMHIWLVCLSTSLHYKVTVYDLTMLGTQALISFPRSFLSLPPLLSISHMHKRNIVFPRIEFPLQLLSAVPTGLAVTHDQSSGAFSRVSGPVSEHCLGHQIKISIRCIVASKPNKWIIRMRLSYKLCATLSIHVLPPTNSSSSCMLICDLSAEKKKEMRKQQWPCYTTAQKIT